MRLAPFGGGHESRRCPDAGGLRQVAARPAEDQLVRSADEMKSSNEFSVTRIQLTTSFWKPA